MSDWSIMLRLIFCVALGWLSVCVPLRAQSCAPRASKTIDRAVQSAVSGDLNTTQSLLEDAEQTCSTSPVVMRKLAGVYRDVLLNLTKADELAKHAQDLDGRKITGQQPVRENSVVRDKWALVVGIGKFAYLGKQNELECPAKDAKDFAHALTDPNVGRFRDDGQHVRVLTDDQATLSGLMSQIDYVSSRARQDDLVVLYISSHGLSSESDKYASGDAQTGYIVTYDTKVDSLLSSAFPMEDLKKVFDHLRAKRIVAFLDTCYSGDSVRWIGKGSKGLAVVPEASYGRIAQGTGRVVIVSSSGSQMSWEGGTNSFFTECLLHAMKQRNGLGTVTQLFNSLDNELPYQVQKAKNAVQTPMMWPVGENIDIVIGSPLE